MAASLIGGLLGKGGQSATLSADRIMVFEPNAERAAQLHEEFGVTIAADNDTLVRQSDIIVIAIKPQVMKQALSPLVAAFAESNPLIVSIVAGITVASILQWLQGDYAVVRIMPNTPALVGAGASGMYANSQVEDSQRELAAQLMNAVGTSAWVASENDIDSVTALSGSGPAYFMLFIQGLIDAGVKAGLEEDTAKQLAVQTAAGAAALVASSDKSLQVLIDNVTSPGGTTEQALKSFEQTELKRIVGEAFDAAKRRSEELAAELG